MTNHRKTLVLSLFCLALAHAAHAGLGEVLRHEKIGSFSGRFMDTLDDKDAFGVAMAALGDLDGDGVSEVVVGSWADDDGGFGHGAIWILFLNRDGTVKAKTKISDFQGGFTGTLDNSDSFGRSVASLGDLDGAGPSVLALAVGAYKDDDGGFDRGAVWVLFLDGVAACPWDCSAAPSGAVDVPDLLALLALWGQGVGSPCDFTGGGIAVPDLLELLANWGPCPQ